MRVPRIVYSILKEDELAALSLQHTQSKSSWQAGEILKKSHYKYLEIKLRAEKFFKLFIEHYNHYNQLIPEGLDINEYFRQYLINAIEKRLSIRENIELIDSPNYKKMKLREPMISKAIVELRESKSLHAQNLYAVIMQFDRYNNFRILPKDVQEPSGFKRRNSTRFKKHLRMSYKLDPYVLFRIKEIYQCNTKSLKNEAWVPLTDEVIRINANEDNLRDFASISLYVFNKREDAETYRELVNSYLGENRNPKKGLLFWPQFRNLIKISLNYTLIHNIAPTRKGLFLAMSKLDLYFQNKANKENYNKTMNEL